MQDPIHSRTVAGRPPIAKTAIRRKTAVILPVVMLLLCLAVEGADSRPDPVQQRSRFRPTRFSPVAPVSAYAFAEEESSGEPIYGSEPSCCDEFGVPVEDSAYCGEDCGEGCGEDYYAGGEYWGDRVVAGPGFPCYRPLMPLCGRFEARGEYLLWWTQGSGVPPLVTTSPAGTQAEQAGVLGQETTTILFGGESLAESSRSGGRITMTYWLQPNRCTGIEASYLGIGKQTSAFYADSDGDPILARPFFNIRNGGDDEQDSLLVAFTTRAEGRVAADVTAEFQGVEVLLRWAMLQQDAHRMDVLVGYRFQRLDDGVSISQFTESTELISQGTTIDLFDRFNSRNRFHGAELGVLYSERYCRWSLEMLMKVGFGNTHSRVSIDGSTTTTVPEEPSVTTSGGLLALPTNMGVYGDNRFTMIPEFGITVGYDLTQRLRATFGYTFIYWSNVARAGDQIDLNVNDSQLSGGTLDGAPRPEFSWITTDFWAQGLNFGLDYRF
ncbi:MAG TPA: BBP7 family outer membrane beta-barrel protein [Thermoguttaceae bacterium]|nr:BBP7 family outer membrane beta-barrel protein [Thermoguttaceae bacterium]